MSAVQVLCSLAETLQASNNDVPSAAKLKNCASTLITRAGTLPMQHHNNIAAIDYSFYISPK